MSFSLPSSFPPTSLSPPHLPSLSHPSEPSFLNPPTRPLLRQGYAHFKLVTRAKQHYEMANPSEALPVPQPINYPGVHITQAPVVQQQQQQQGSYGYVQQSAPVYQQQVSPVMVQQQQQQQQPQSADRQPGFVVSTPDDEPRQAQAAAVRQQQVRTFRLESPHSLRISWREQMTLFLTRD